MRFVLPVVVFVACAPRVPPTRALPTDPSARDLACSLADEVGPRLAGSPGDARAVAWALDKMKSLGLANVRAEAVKVPHWERGEASAELLSPVSRRLHLAALGGSVDGSVEAEVVRVESLEQLQALPDAQVKGRIVFYDKVMARTVSGEGYGKGMDVRRSGASEAAKKGAVASLIRSLGTSESRFPHTGQMRYADDAPKVPAAALAIPDAELLRRTLARGAPVRLRLALGPKLLGEADSANVIGEVVGASKPDEVVLLGAHLDSWDLGDGAVDDAAGVGVVLDVAARMAKSAPRRTVRVVLFANEENGLRGAKGYVTAHAAELPRHVAAMEIDSGAGLATKVVYRGGAGADVAMASLTPGLAELGLPAAEAGAAGGADTEALEGVPQLELDQDRARYFDVHHTADDTCDKIQAGELAQVAQVALLVTRHLTELTGDLGRVVPEPKK